jgi:hypothetical protein
MESLLRELGLESAGTVHSVSRDDVAAAVRSAIEHRRECLAKLRIAQAHLAARAGNNLAFVKLYHEFDG